MIRKERALRDVQHRAKNCLQLVMALLQLQVAQVKDPGARRAFERTLRRLDRLTLLFQELRESGRDADVDLARYVSGIVDLDRNALHEQCEDTEDGAFDDDPQVELDLEPVEVDLATATSLVFILGELLAGSRGHVFSGRGHIRITLRRTREEIVLTVADNGRPLPDGFEEDKMSSLMVDALTARLEGTLSRWRD